MKERRKRLTRETCTEDQLRCWGAVSWIFGGDHHIMHPVYERGYGLQTSVPCRMATYDGDILTRIVLVSHCDAVRISLENGGPYRLNLIAHPRRADATCWSERHPTLPELIEKADKLNSETYLTKTVVELQKCRGLLQEVISGGVSHRAASYSEVQLSHSTLNEIRKTLGLDKCGRCHKCLAGQVDQTTGIPVTASRMVLCGICGNKRCPHASDCSLDCTSSNEPGQPGSLYG